MGGRHVDFSVRQWQTYGSQADQRKQTQALAQVREYAINLPRNFKTGRNLLLVGPMGVGKDSLTGIVLRTAIRNGMPATWEDGFMLLQRLADATRFSSGESVGSIIQKLTDVPLLALSDLVQEGRPLSVSELNFLNCLIDARYRHLRPTVFSLNCQSWQSLKESLSARVVDRIRQDAVEVQMFWPSFRTPAAKKATK